MKNITKKLFSILAISLLSITLWAQPMPPNPNSGNGGAPVGGGSAPIEGGITILFILGAAWAGKKIYSTRKRLLDD